MRSNFLLQLYCTNVHLMSCIFVQIFIVVTPRVINRSIDFCVENIAIATMSMPFSVLLLDCIKIRRYFITQECGTCFFDSTLLYFFVEIAGDSNGNDHARMYYVVIMRCCLVSSLACFGSDWQSLFTRMRLSIYILSLQILRLNKLVVINSFML